MTKQFQESVENYARSNPEVTAMFKAIITDFNTKIVQLNEIVANCAFRIEELENKYSSNQKHLH